MPIQKKMYVLVRLDLSTQYGLVQASHALAQYALELPDLFKIWNNSTLVCLGVRNLIDMKTWDEKLSLMDKSYKCFFEPDLEGQLTSIACFDTGEIFKNLKIV
jgi:hypothetical protein